ncbi:hypothetical protein [Salinibacterium sp.]|uniref:hypothetical protein n=1 Tax=Salinibacterium sp. TaxID=1915057 RepID=UPI00286A6B82|nr:hypothetical protein [Salinibacterium sp.]
MTAAMTGDIVVQLRGGTYRMSSTWAFSNSERDSGTNGYRVTYTAYSGEIPRISGAKKITGWTLYDAAKNIWSAPVGTSLRTRELYVNGVRAHIARGPSNPTGWGTPTSTGLLAPDSTLASWPDIVGTEVVSENTWVHKSCPITAASGTSVTLAQPCYANAGVPFVFNSGDRIPQEKFNVSWLQNAYELLNNPGTFYLKSSAGTLFYVPRANEDLASADVEAPVLETLVRGTGTAAAPLTNITFSGLVFEHATWLEPSTSGGYAEGQAGWHITGANTQVPMANLTRTAGNLVFDHSTNLNFTGDTFTHLGSVGLELTLGSKNNTILGSTFTDIGSNALQIGSVTVADRFPADGDKVTGNTVKNSVITYAGQVYRGAVGIFVGYTTGTTITHNAIGQLPYTAISVNLGWEGLSYSGDATVTYNEIFQDMGVLTDGGALYSQMAMASPSVMKYNYLHDEKTTWGGAVYLDATTGNWTVQNNVFDTGTGASRFIQCCFAVEARNNIVQFNYSNASGTARGVPHPSNTVNNNYDNLTSFPAEAQTIMAGAGLEPAFAYLLSQRTYNDTTNGINYSGNGWTYSPDRGYGDVGDDLRYSNAAGAAVTIPFTGSGISWLTQRSTFTGPVQVYVDGVDQGTITPPTSGAPYPTRQVGYSINGLAAGNHTLKIVNNGAALITVDAFTVSGPRTAVNDGAAGVIYSGSGWTYASGRGYGDFGDDLHYNYSAGATVQYAFTGSGIGWLAQRSSFTGPVQVYVDGVDQGVITPKSSGSPYPVQQVEYNITGLAAGPHNLKIVNTTSKLFTVDAFTIENNRKTSNDTDLAVIYSGAGWTYASARGYGDFGDDVHYSRAAGATVTVPFTGSGIAWLAQASTFTGAVQVYVDGVDQGAITPAKSGSPYPTQQIGYSITGLTAGEHTLKIVNNGAALITVDAFTVKQ